MSNIAENKALALAKQFDIQGSSQELIRILKATAFKGSASDEQFAALLIVAAQYNLNPFTREIYAFPDRNNGIIPIVGIDGWSRLINGNKQFDGMEFEQDAESCTCKIYRKDRGHPVAVTEFMDECRRDTMPWKTHPRRMLRHKAIIQAARLAFGLTGIFDEDEGERIIDAKDNVSPNEISPFRGDEDNEERANLIETGEKVAMRGLEELRTWLVEIGKESRQILGTDEMNRLKSIAEQTVNVDPSEQ